MPKNEFILAGKKFITSKKAALLFGYTQDYIGQLCRGEKIDARRIGRTWYVCEKSILEHKKLYNGALASRSGLATKREEVTIPKDAKKLPVSFPESDSGKLQVGLGKTEIPKIGFGSVPLKGFDEASRVASEFQYANESSPILPELHHSTFEPKKNISPFFQKSLSFVLATVLVVGSYVYQDEIFAEAARGFRVVQNTVAIVAQKIQKLRLAEVRKAKPLGFIFDQKPKLSWIDSKISAEQVAATFGSAGFVDSDKLAEAVSGATGIADFDYFENFTAKQSAVVPMFIGTEADKLLALVEKVLPDKQRMALENVAQTTYEELHPLFQKTSRFLASLFGRQVPVNLAVDNKITPPLTPPQKEGVKEVVVISPRQVIQEITKNISYAGISREEFENRLQDIATKFFSETSRLSTATSNNSTYINNVYNTVAGTNDIDMLHNVDISDSSTFTNGAITNSTITNSVITNATTTNFFTSAINAVSSIFSSITGGSATIGSLTATSSATLSYTGANMLITTDGTGKLVSSSTPTAAY